MAIYDLRSEVSEEHIYTSQYSKVNVVLSIFL